MTVACPGCGGPVEDDTLWLAQATPEDPVRAYCGPVCGEHADQGIQPPCSEFGLR